MLTDHRIEQERWALRRRERRKLAWPFGMLIATLAPWDWFINPLSFRDQAPGAGPPALDLAFGRITEFLSRIVSDAGRSIGWVIAEEFGRLGGRYHCHALISGVQHLSRQFWQREAYRCFGQTRIELFDPKRDGAFYVAKYEGRLTGHIHFGGCLRGVDLSKCEQSHSEGGGRDRTVSPPLPSRFYRRCWHGWHR
jgi:hypothetical protein